MRDTVVRRMPQRIGAGQPKRAIDRLHAVPYRQGCSTRKDKRTFAIRNLVVRIFMGPRAQIERRCALRFREIHFAGRGHFAIRHDRGLPTARDRQPPPIEVQRTADKDILATGTVHRRVVIKVKIISIRRRIIIHRHLDCAFPSGGARTRQMDVPVWDLAVRLEHKRRTVAHEHAV